MVRGGTRGTNWIEKSVSDWPAQSPAGKWTGLNYRARIGRSRDAGRDGIGRSRNGRGRARSDWPERGSRAARGPAGAGRSAARGGPSAGHPEAAQPPARCASASGAGAERGRPGRGSTDLSQPKLGRGGRQRGWERGASGGAGPARAQVGGTGRGSGGAPEGRSGGSKGPGHFFPFRAFLPYLGIPPIFGHFYLFWGIFSHIWAFFFLLCLSSFSVWAFFPLWALFPHWVLAEAGEPASSPMLRPTPPRLEQVGEAHLGQDHLQPVGASSC